ncbi:hypothetical protein [Anaeromyxobacter dehalogenans]|uniref:hypothetical protein n=1 Tax=Anaeromyxobacter dehalogenans TaxID=161493 RepID=UPI0002E6FE3A|nr:hypothetical protein [Anaeromyxobacter dehalogenans]
MASRRARSRPSDAAARPDPRVRALFAAPPAEFVARRDALARELAPDRSAEAARVRRLRRPPLAAWLLNALARERPEALAAVLEAGDRLRQAQARAVRGEGGALREAAAALHDAIAEALGAVRAIAGAAGPGAAAAQLGTVERGLRAAATAAPDEREALRAGVLERLPEAGGLELLGGLAPQPGAGPEAAPPGRSRAGRQAERAGRRARAEAAERERERRRIRAEAERLERERQRAAERLRRAARAVERAQGALQAARAAAEAAGAAAEAARARAQAAGPAGGSPALPARPRRGAGRARGPAL